MRVISLAYFYAPAFVFLMFATAPAASQWTGPGCPAVHFYSNYPFAFPKDNPTRCYVLYENRTMKYNRGVHTDAVGWCSGLYKFAYPAVPKTKEELKNILSMIVDKSTYLLGIFVTDDGKLTDFANEPLDNSLGIDPKPSTALFLTKSGASYRTAKTIYLVCQINVGTSMVTDETETEATTMATDETETEATTMATKETETETEATTEAETETASDATPAAVTDLPPSDATAAEDADGDAMTTRFSVVFFFLMAFVLA